MIYNPLKVKSDRRSSYTKHHPVKVSGDQKMGNFLTASYLGHFFNFCFDKKKDFILKIYKKLFEQKFNLVHLIKILDIGHSSH